MTTLALAAPGTPTVDAAARTITGLAVPFGPVGQTSAGRLQFAAGSLSWTDPKRVELLVEHDQQRPVGYAVELTEQSDGLHATFHVPEGAAGDQALAEAGNGLRDAFSVGVQLDDATATRLRRAQGAAVAGTGQLRETSLVSVPAFDDARVGSVAAHADLTVSSWADPSASSTTPATAPGDTVPDEPTPTPAPTEPTPTPAPTVPTQPTEPVTTASAAPRATAGAAVVTSEPATYSFSADGPSLVVDAWNARTAGDGEAAARLHRYNAELSSGNPASVMALAAVMQTTDVGSDAVVAPNVRRPDLLRQAIDRGRPITSRLSVVPIRNAQPFLIPVVGEFTGVADHTEGTAHVPEGTLSLGDATLAPKALSGAFRMSREIIDSSNPVIDRIALAAMLKDYRRQSEARLFTALAAAAGVATAVAGPVALDIAIMGFGNDDSDVPDVGVASKQAMQNLASYLDGDNRQLISRVQPTNAPGTTTGVRFDIGGVQFGKAATVTGTDVLVMDSSAVLVVESATQTFRFDEVEGPGIVKLALFGYHGAAVLDDTLVERYSIAAPAVA